MCLFEGRSEKHFNFGGCQGSELYKCVFTVGPNEANFQSVLNDINYFNDCTIKNTFMDRDNSVNIATRYGSDVMGIESGLGRYFPHPFRPTLGPNQPPTR